MSGRTNPMSFDSDSGSGVPMFSKNGTALSNAERQKIAHKKGVCLTCGVRVAEIKGVLRNRIPLTNKDVYQGICIKCNGSSVPSAVLQEWQQRNAPPAAGSKQPGNKRLKNAAKAVRLANMATTHPPRANTAPELTAEVTHAHKQQSYMPSASWNTPSPTYSHEQARSNSDASLLSTPSSQSHRPGGGRNSSSQHHRDSDASNISLPALGRVSTTEVHNSLRPVSERNHRNSSETRNIASTPITPFVPPSPPPQQPLDPEDYATASMDVDSFSLMRDMTDHRDKPDVLRKALHGFRNLADDQAGGLYEIHDVIERCIVQNDESSNRVVMLALGAIWGICSKDDDKKRDADTAGCVDLVVDCLSKYQSDPETTHWALGTLVSLALVGESRSLIARKGGIEGILNALESHESSPTVFEWASRALYSMITPHSESDSNNSLSDINRNMIAIEGHDGINILVSAMKLHSYGGAVAEWWAMKVLLRLQDHPDESVVENFRNQLLENNLPEVCSRILKAQSTTPDLFVATTEMLSMLIQFSALTLDAKDCLNPIMRCLGHEKATPEMMSSGAFLLALISRGDNHIRAQILGDRCVKKLISTGSTHVKNLQLVINTLYLLCSLSCNMAAFDPSLFGEVKALIESASDKHGNNISDLDVLICNFICNSAAAAESNPESFPLSVLGRICSASGAASNPETGRAFSWIATKFPNLLNLGRDSTNEADANGVQQLLESLCDTEIDVQSSSCATLTSLVSISEEIRTCALNEGGLATALAALLVVESEPLAINLLELISALVISDNRRATQIPDEMVPGVLRAMQQGPVAASIGCTAIRNCMLASDPEFALNTTGLAPTLCGILDSPSTPDVTVIEACGAVWAYCLKQASDANELSSIFNSLLGLCDKHKGNKETPFNSPVITEAAGALSSVLYKLRESPIPIPDADVDLLIAVLDLVIECDVENVVLMERMLDTIATLCFFCKEVLIQFGVIVVVIDCMVEHEGNEQIQKQGCAILALLASTENLQVNLSIAETDGIDMIVSALAGFADNLEIQTDACRALSHLSIDHESRMMICSQGGMILLVNALNAHPKEVILLDAACSSLLNLSSDAEEEVLVGSNVIEAVIATMRSQVDSSRVQEKCLGVLQNISMRSRQCKAMVSNAGGLEAVLATIREFIGTPSVVERAITTLWSLGVLEQNHNWIADNQGITLIINGMLANITHEKVQRQACGCLCTLSTSSCTKLMIRNVGGVDAVVYAMWAHYNSEDLLAEACRALSSLAVNVETNEVMLATEGEITAILGAMRRFPNSEKLQEHACVALRNFMLSSDNLPLIKFQKDEVEELMNVAATRYPNRCGDRARQVLQCIGA